MNARWGLAVTAALVLCAASASADTLFVSTPNGKTVNMRTGAGKRYNVLKRVPNGYAVTVDEEDESGWLLCTYEGYHGYIDSSFLSEMPGAIYDFALNCYEASVKPSRDGGYVNLRKQPTKESGVICRYNKGDELFVLRTNSTWSLIYDPNSCDYGFMQSSFLSYEQPLDPHDVVNCLIESAQLIPAPEEPVVIYVPTEVYPTESDDTLYNQDEYGSYMPAHPTLESDGAYSDEYGTFTPAHPTEEEDSGTRFDEFGTYTPAHPTLENDGMTETYPTEDNVPDPVG